MNIIAMKIVAMVALTGTFLVSASASGQSAGPDYDAILDRFNALLASYDDKCGYRIGNSVWAIGGSLDRTSDTLFGEIYGFDGGEMLHRSYRLATNGQEVAIAGPAQTLFLKRKDRAGAVTFRICSRRADESLNCRFFGDTFHICLLYG